MTEQLKVFIDSLTDKQKKQLNEILGAKPQTKMWKPITEETYYYLNYWGEINSGRWTNDTSDNWLFDSGNCFRSEEEAEFYKEKLLVTAELQRFAEEHNEPIDWNNAEQPKYYLSYDYEEATIDVFLLFSISYPMTCFTSEYIAKQAIEAVGENRIKKYYLGVTE